MTNKELEAKVVGLGILVVALEGRVKELETIVEGKAVITVQQTPDTVPQVLERASTIPVVPPVNISPRNVVDRFQNGYADLG